MVLQKKKEKKKDNLMHVPSTLKKLQKQGASSWWDPNCWLKFTAAHPTVVHQSGGLHQSISQPSDRH